MLLAIALALSASLFVGACSFSQASDESRALTLLRSSIATTTEIDLLIAVELEDIRTAGEAAEAVVTVPGFPFDASLTPAEARDLSSDGIRDRLLDQAAASVYDRGLAAFDRSGGQDVDSLTAQGMLNRMLGSLTDANHGRAVLASWVLLVLTVVLGALAVVIRSGPRRFLVLGGALSLAGCLGLIASGLLMLTVRVLGGGSDPFVTALRSLVESLAEVPLRNYTVLAFLGLGVWAIAPILHLIERRSPPDANGDYEEWGHGIEEDWVSPDESELREGWDRGQA